MIMALALNNVEFVELLLEYGVSIGSILTKEVVEFLYGYRALDKSSPMRYLHLPEVCSTEIAVAECRMDQSRSDRFRNMHSANWTEDFKLKVLAIA